MKTFFFHFPKVLYRRILSFFFHSDVQLAFFISSSDPPPLLKWRYGPFRVYDIRFLLIIVTITYTCPSSDVTSSSSSAYYDDINNSDNDNCASRTHAHRQVINNYVRTTCANKHNNRPGDCRSCGKWLRVSRVVGVGDTGFVNAVTYPEGGLG